MPMPCIPTAITTQQQQRQPPPGLPERKLEAFRCKVLEYCHAVEQTQSRLAVEIGTTGTSLCHKFKGTRKLTRFDIILVVKVLVTWGAITTKNQAIELFTLAGLFHTTNTNHDTSTLLGGVNWANTAPFNQLLDGDGNNNPHTLDVPPSLTTWHLLINQVQTLADRVRQLEAAQCQHPVGATTTAHASTNAPTPATLDTPATPNPFIPTTAALSRQQLWLANNNPELGLDVPGFPVTRGYAATDTDVPVLPVVTKRNDEVVAI
jgi:hypothetical protein